MHDYQNFNCLFWNRNWIPEIKLSSIDTDRLCLYFEMVMHISFEKFSGIDLMYAKTCDNELKFTKVVKELFTRLPYDIKYKLIYDNLFCGISNLLIGKNKFICALAIMSLFFDLWWLIKYRCMQRYIRTKLDIWSYWPN